MSLPPTSGIGPAQVTQQEDMESTARTTFDSLMRTFEQIADDIILQDIRRFSNPDTTAMVIKVPTRDIYFPVIKYNEVGDLWRWAITMLDSALFNRDVGDEFGEGFLMSFLLCLTPNLTRGISKIIDQQDVKMKPIQIHASEGHLTGKTEEAERIVNLINYDGDGRSTRLVQGRYAVRLRGKCEETAYLTILTHIVLIATKACTTPEKCVVDARSRMASLLKVLPISVDWFLTDEAAEAIAKYIRGFMPIRRAIVKLVVACEKTDSYPPHIAASVTKAGTHLKMSGLTGFQMVRQYVFEEKSPIMAMHLCRSDVVYFTELLHVYEKLGDDGPYLKFLGELTADLFNRHKYKFLYAYAIGFASVAEPSMAGYVIGDTYKGLFSYKLGVEAAKKSTGANKKIIH